MAWHNLLVAAYNSGTKPVRRPAARELLRDVYVQWCGAWTGTRLAAPRAFLQGWADSVCLEAAVFARLTVAS